MTLCRHPSLRYESEPFNVDHPLAPMRLALTRWFEFTPASPRREEIAAAFDAYLGAGALKMAGRICRSNGWSIGTPQQFFRQAIALARRRRLLVKDPLALLSAAWLHERYGFKVICTFRSPLAYVGSMKAAGWDFDFENLASQRGLMEGWLATYRAEIEHMCRAPSDFIDRACLLWNILHHVIETYRHDHPDWLFVCHEDLATEPLAGFHAIFDHLDLDLGPEIEAYIEAFTREENPREASTIHYQPRASRHSLGTWEDRLSAEEAERVRSGTRAVAKLFYS